MKKLVTEVVQGSIGHEMGIAPGDMLVSINGLEVKDVFDYRMAVSDNSFEMLVQKKNGEDWLLSIEKDWDEDLGLVFESGLMDKVRVCANNCVFCFIQQNPEGNMRETIYFKDDDYRLSFLHGNYITLTNMGQGDVDRILAQRLSPINISVHTTNPALRVRMMGNKGAGESLKFLRQLADGGIVLGLQVVLVKGYNDGKELERTINDLVPFVKPGFSLSVVPAGLTRHRKNLPRLVPLNPADCKAAIALVEHFQQQFLKSRGTRFVYCADELYINAGLEVPCYASYEDFPQIENGVGMMAAFRHEFESAAKNVTAWTNSKITVATGTAAYDFMRGLKLPRGVSVKAIKNDFFGHSVTVAGLLTGRDIISQLKGQDLGDLLLLPTCCLRHGEDVLLDDAALADVSTALDVRVAAVNPNAADFIDILTGGLG